MSVAGYDSEVYVTDDCISSIPLAGQLGPIIVSASALSSAPLDSSLNRTGQWTGSITNTPVAINSDDRGSRRDIVTTVNRSESQLEFLREFPKTGPGTKAGNMLRQYWHPLCLSGDLKDIPYAVRMLGEDLVAFRSGDGTIGLIGAVCPHRCASLEYGQVRQCGLQCSYHGWTFDNRGRCIDMPLEPVDSPLLNEVQHIWYAAEEWAGVIWCYMGPDKADPPPLPKIDIMARTDGELVLSRGDFRDYTYLNFMENFADIGHSYVLHMLEPGTVPEEVKPWCDMTVDTEWRNSKFRVFETDFGMKSVVVHNTADPDVKFVNSWSFAFPTHFRFGGILAGLPPDFTNDRREGGGMLRIIDDTHSEIFRYTLIRPGNFRSNFFPRQSNIARGLDDGIRGTVEKKDYDNRKYPAWEGVPPVEDLVIQESQGAIPPYKGEHLASSDAGIALYRRLFRKSMEDVAAGGKAKPALTNKDGIIEVDTFKGLVKTGDIVLGPKNMPSSEDGRGLIRDADGNLVFA
ncbi:MAG: nitrite reductase/ring-hydroxylating ferredoxin subunit [Alphaproteobacteria bacterium]|jgi:nitrite reductase/ring-hydroxylating ferredoxin subunit